MKFNLIALPIVFATGCRLATLTQTQTITTVLTTVVTVESIFCNGALKPTSSTIRPIPAPIKVEVPIETPPPTSSRPRPGNCRTSIITTEINNIRVPTSVKICPYPPFTFTIPKESDPSPTGKPSTEETPVDEEVPTDEVPIDEPLTSTVLLDGACVTRTTEIVSDKKTITTVTTACPYPDRKTSVSRSPIPIKKTRQDSTTTPIAMIPKPTPYGKGTGCPPSKIQKFSPTCLGERKKKCKTPCTSTVTVTSAGACSCIGAKALVTGTTLGPIMCPDYCGCQTSTTWQFPAACKTLKPKPPPKPTMDDEEDGYGSGGY
ncbi:hypothetical protein TWF970_003347 [Orbilia oligospora]|uniref:Uncharacterized protein n=1 Tax=Orbilia oligospora TaxID=2813651 RepID=A0A7C8VGA4_ORBOL|nr:hypothetical protein TWF970_003347 [Orbilia oligospora]